MDFRDVSARKLHDGRRTILDGEWRDQECNARALGLRKCLVEVSDFVAGQLASVRIRQMTVGCERRHATEVGFYSDATVRLAGAPDLDTGRGGVVGDDSSMRKPDEGSNKVVEAQR